MAAAALGDLASGAASSALNFAFSKALQEDAQQFQTSFYKQRYQRQMADMRKAGLNPILSYRTGVPGMAGGGIAGITGGAGLAQSAEAGARVTRIGTEKKLIAQQTQTSAAQARQAGTQSDLNLWSARQAKLAGDQQMYQNVQNRLRADFYTGKAGKPAVYIQEGAGTAGSFMRGVRGAVTTFGRGK